MNTAIQSHKDLIVWQKSMDLVVLIYKITESFPRTEQYGLVSQMRRSSVSLPSNVAEGWRRGTGKEYNRFLHIAFGSGGELETQMELARRLDYLGEEDFKKSNSLLEEVLKMLNSMTRSIG